jgi:hypothetical protein
MSTSLNRTHRRMGGRYSSMFFGAFLAQCVEVIRHYRPVFSIDGKFLIGKYWGTLLIAISVNTNNKLVPFTFALVEKENHDSWGWLVKRTMYPCLVHVLTCHFICSHMSFHVLVVGSN